MHTILCLQSYADHRDLHSFPTRRSSDLAKEPTWTFPVVANGRLYLRDQHVLRCYDLRAPEREPARKPDRKSTRLNSSHVAISYAVFCLKKKKIKSIKSRRYNQHPYP